MKRLIAMLPAAGICEFSACGTEGRWPVADTEAKQQWSQTLLLFLLEAVCTCAVFGASWVIGLLDAGITKAVNYITLFIFPT